MCEWEVTSFAITLPFPLTTHINLRNLYQLTDLQEENKDSTLFPVMNASAAWVIAHNRVIVAISKHVIAK